MTGWYRLSLAIKYQIMAHAFSISYAFNVWGFQGEPNHLSAFTSLGSVLKDEGGNCTALNDMFVQGIVKAQRAENIITNSYTKYLWPSLLQVFELTLYFPSAILSLTPLERAVVEGPVCTTHQPLLTLQPLRCLQLLGWEFQQSSS